MFSLPECSVRSRSPGNHLKLGGLGLALGDRKGRQDWESLQQGGPVLHWIEVFQPAQAEPFCGSFAHQ
jgi:hypothetical protein